jgi:hypothetical protein
MKLFTLSVALCGVCFGQNSPRGAVTRQVSEGACSINASEVRGNVNVSISGPSCNNLSKADVTLIEQLVELLREDIGSRRSQTTTLTDYNPYKSANDFSLPSATTIPIVPTIISHAGVAGIDYPVYQNLSGLPAKDHMIGLEPSTGMVFTGNPRPTWGAGYPFTNAPVSVSPIVIGADHPLEFNSVSALSANNQIVGLQPPPGVNFSGNSALGPTLESVSLTFANSAVGINSLITGTDHTIALQNASDPIANDHPFVFQSPAGLVFSANSAPPLGAAYPFTNTPVGTSPIITGVDHPLVLNRVSDPNTIDHIAVLQPPAGVAFPGNSALGTTLDSVSLTFANTPVNTNPLITGADHPLVFQTISDLTANDHMIGMQLPAGLVFPSSITAPTWDSVSLTFKNTPPGTSPISAGADQPLVFKSVSDLTENDHIIGLQPPASLVSTGEVTAGATWRVTYPFTNAPVGSSSIITGTDYASLSKSFSDITSSGHIVTAWTITYLAADPR